MLAAWGLSTGVAPVGGSTLKLQVNADARPVAEAVLSLRPQQPTMGAPGRVVVDQIGSQFVPRVTAVQVGTAVDFPNSDQTRHQVYSFSPAKRFSLPLYSGTPPEPVLFDQPGVVSLGCNIHDWMQGYIVVVDTPYFAVTDASGAAIIEAPVGHYTLEVWHERLLGDASQNIELSAGEVRLPLSIELSPPPPPRGSERLRALQDRLREQRGRD
ncbi:methylamine utilization protein [Pseudoxanthomonas sp. CAU 1598]|uniref:Methylamine utilization protein n=2 Tax=Pseudomarimonas arenosa TaxID=2774145 RepID=A0AAW3ZIE1_9GAMM|nr:methylamine utilization protein [Pseudomarimonas arenosa]